jgi:hypothetical protein
MALQASGSISFSQISNEFGRPPGKNIGAYRLNGGQTVGSLANLPLDAGIPRSGPISFGNFYSKKLNIVVDFHSGVDETRQIARDRYNLPNDAGVKVIGGFKSKPSSGAGSRVITHVNKTIGSAQGNINNVALKTGTWEPNTNLEIQIGPSGKLIGSGGNGGNGSTGRGGDATSGTSALGVQYSTTIINQGLIFGGRGGGGGGGGATFRRCGKNQRGCKGGTTRSITGGGGAGGQGFPGGTGGTGGNSGTSGTTEQNGSFGNGVFREGTSAGYSGTSGAGGSIESSGGAGSPGSGGGSGGSRGYAIIVSPGVSVIDYIGNPRNGAQLDNGTVL